MKFDKNLLIKVGGLVLIGAGTLIGALSDKKSQDSTIAKLVDEALKEK